MLGLWSDLSTKHMHTIHWIPGDQFMYSECVQMFFANGVDSHIYIVTFKANS